MYIAGIFMQDKFVTGLTTNTPVSAGGNIAVLNASKEYRLVDANGKEYDLFQADEVHYLFPCSAPKGGLLAVSINENGVPEFSVSIAELIIRGRGDFTLQIKEKTFLSLSALGYHVKQVKL